MNSSNYAIMILNLLMRHEELNTRQLCQMTGCDRKTVYKSMDVLEVNGFGIDISRPNGREPLRYKLNGVYGLSE